MELRLPRGRVLKIDISWSRSGHAPVTGSSADVDPEVEEVLRRARLKTIREYEEGRRRLEAGGSA
jgi:hypothetical protein